MNRLSSEYEGYDKMKRLYRSNNDRMVSGVLGGLGDFFGIDPTIVRLLFVVSLFLSAGTSFFAYIIAIFIIPNDRVIR